MASPLAYSGAWRAQSGYIDRALAPGPGVDPSHMRPDAADLGRVPEGRPRADYPPLYLTEDPAAAYAWAVDTPGVVLDLEPVTHDAGDPDVLHPAPVQGAEGSVVPPGAVAHQVDRGGALKTSYSPRSGRAHDERYETPRFETPPTQGDLSVANHRGTNSLPQNNPEGYRLGWTVWRRHNRRMFYDYRQHTERLLHPAGAQAAQESPALERGRANRYTSPFPWNRQTKVSAPQSPTQRRDPPPWDQAVLTDGSEDPDQDFADWVVG
jgi:hypothetical protein